MYEIISERREERGERGREHIPQKVIINIQLENSHKSLSTVLSIQELLNAL